MGGNLSNGRESAKPASRRRQSKADDRVDKLIGMVDQLIGMLEKEQAARAGDLARERMEHQIKAARWELHFCVRPSSRRCCGVRTPPVPRWAGRCSSSSSWITWWIKRNPISCPPTPSSGTCSSATPNRSSASRGLT